MDHSPVRELPEILQSVSSPGRFSVFGATEIFLPRIDVDGVGPVALPLLPEQADRLAAVSSPAPYGLGERTLVDTRVRNSGQIDPSRIRIFGKHWPKDLDRILTRVAEGLGVEDAIEADFYKMLVYEKGGFFVDHRDTEKAPGMFATLVIVLPSSFSGGELVVRHKGEETVHDLHGTDPSEVAFAAFYADCVHEVRPVTSGCRLALIYNLIKPGGGRNGSPPDYVREKNRMVRLLKDWSSSPDPAKLIYPLDHAYTPAGLSLSGLKGRDAAAAKLLSAAALESDCDLHLALVTIEESGSASHAGYGRSRWDEEDYDDYDVDEIFDRSALLSDWQGPDGSRPSFGSMPFKESELCPPECFDDLEEYETSFQEATGNAGASFERTYSSAAFVLWPKTRRVDILSSEGLAVGLPSLSELVVRWERGGSSPDSHEKREALALAKRLTSTWPTGWFPRITTNRTDASEMLSLLIRLGDASLMEAFLGALASSKRYEESDNVFILKLFGRIPAENVARGIEEVIAQNALRVPEACNSLLSLSADAVKKNSGTDGRLSVLSPPLRAIVRLLLDSSEPISAEGNTAKIVSILLESAERIGLPSSEEVLDRVLARSDRYTPDQALVPAALLLLGSPKTKNTPSTLRLARFCLEFLRNRTSRPLSPPSDWSRPSSIACRCNLCLELSRFLHSSDEPVARFKLPGDGRTHLEHSIRTNPCDLEVKTEKVSRPYSLVCTKNQATYDQKVQQRESDLKNLAKIEKGLGTSPD